jgi:GTPase SAR1 family protein
MEIRQPAHTITDRPDKKIDRLIEHIDYTNQIKWPFIIALIGQPGSGKTSFLLNLIEDYEKYNIIDHITIFTGTRDQVEQFEKIKNVEVHTTFDPIKMRQYISEIENYQMLR